MPLNPDAVKPRKLRQDSWSESTANHLEEHLKLDKPSGIDLISTDTHPIKATKLALDISKTNEIAIENSKTG